MNTTEEENSEILDNLKFFEDNVAEKDTKHRLKRGEWLRKKHKQNQATKQNECKKNKSFMD